MDDYELIDAGDGERLERFGDHLVIRPAPGAVMPRRSPGRWRDAGLQFDRDRGWTGAAPADWTIHLDGIALHLRPTAAGQVGVFPEHAATLPWLRDRVAARRARTGEPASVLHLFAYTGLATLAMARTGASVVHLDAARPTVAWARENAAANDLADAPIRWIVDDATTFVAREVRRDRRYDGVVLDPPSYGHGPGRATAWRIERDLPPLLDAIERVLAPDGFILLTAHTPTLDADRLAEALGGRAGRTEAGELAIDATSGARLRLGHFARVDRASWTR